MSFATWADSTAPPTAVEKRIAHQIRVLRENKWTWEKIAEAFNVTVEQAIWLAGNA